MTVLAECSDCEVTQPLGNRVAPSDGFQSATACPECGSKSYRTRCTSDGLSGREMREVLKTVDGVGVGTLENIEASAGNLTRLKAITTDELTTIDGVGETTAERIQNALG